MFEKNFRSKKILKFAKDAPYCMACGKSNDGTIVAAHSNEILDGKAKNVKSHDFRISYLCYTCHYKVDQANIPREEKREIWESGHRASIGWLFNSGRLQIVDPPKYD